MYSELPNSAKPFMEWPWSQIEPFYLALIERPIDSTHVDAWLADWSRLTDLVQETFTRLQIATAVDTTDQEAERKYQSTAARYQEKEGPPIAREILTKLGARGKLVEEVCDIVGHHHMPRDEETLNFKIVHDADLIVNLEERQKDRKTHRDKLREIIEERILTRAGKRLARKALLGEET